MLANLRVGFIFTVGILLSMIGDSAQAENWPQWRGPNNDGVSHETDLATTWDANKNIAWKIKLPGMAGSTPIVWGERIYLTSEDGDQTVLLCISTGGKELWKKPIGRGKHRFMNNEANYASASPCTDGEHVFAYVGSGEFACFEMDGKELWTFNTQERYGKFQIQFGMHTTPVLHGDRLYFQLIHSGGATVHAIDKKTGQDVWRVLRQSDGRAECEHSYASVCVWQKQDNAYLISHGADYAIGHSLKDGSELWRVGDLNPKDKYNPTLRFVASPVATQDLIVIPSAKNGPVVGLKPEARGAIGAGSSFEQWRRPNNTPDVPSPLVHDGLVYLCRETGILICMDAKTGKEHYSERTHNQRHRASPVYADGKIYLTARDGTVSVVKAGTEFKLLATNRLPDQISASPVISGGKIYLRGFESLYAIMPDAKTSRIPGGFGSEPALFLTRLTPP